MTRLEICVDDVAGARIAETCGADRIEICAALDRGGITPSVGLVARALAETERVGVQVLIRPRPGSFVFDPDEQRVMLADIDALLNLPHAHRLGFVLNALTVDGSIDVGTTRALRAVAGDVPTTFSRAFDATTDPARALDVLVELGVDRVLTGGGPGPAAQHLDALRALVDRAGEAIIVLAAGGIRAGTVAATVEASGVREVHLRALRDGSDRTDPDEVVAVRRALATVSA